MHSAEHLTIYARLIESLLGENSAAQYPMPQRYDIPSLVVNQQPSGAFLPENPSTHPETLWFDELLILHAVANYALTSRDAKFQKAAAKSAEYHLQEIQPDHATSDPWALLAFIQFAPPLADQLLHAVQLNYPNGVYGKALLLLQDVLYGLRILMVKES